MRLQLTFLTNFLVNLSKWLLTNLLRNCPQMNVTGLYRWWVKVGSGDGLVPSSIKPLPEPQLTHISGRACLFSKSSLARLQEFWNSPICLYEIKRKSLFKSTCPTGSFIWPGPSGNKKRRALYLCHHMTSLGHILSNYVVNTVSADALAVRC